MLKVFAPVGVAGGIMASSLVGTKFVASDSPTRAVAGGMVIFGGITTAAGSAAAMSGAKAGAALLVPGLAFLAGGLILGSIAKA